MESIGFVLFALAFLGGIWGLNRLLSRSRRNEGSDHGGGWSSTSEGM